MEHIPGHDKDFVFRSFVRSFLMYTSFKDGSKDKGRDLPRLTESSGENCHNLDRMNTVWKNMEHTLRRIYDYEDINRCYWWAPRGTCQH
jgi:hypothetical protein